VVVEPLESYRLKNTRQNLKSKGFKKYSCTTTTSAIIKCPGCILHDAQHLVEANQQAHRNFRSSSLCIFKQSAEVAHLLPVKPHQLYQDITLLKHNLNDLLAQYESNTNPFPLQTLPSSGIIQENDESNRYLDSYSNRNPSIDLVCELIDQLISSPVLSHNLKEIAITLRSDPEI